MKKLLLPSSCLGLLSAILFVSFTTPSAPLPEIKDTKDIKSTLDSSQSVETIFSYKDIDYKNISAIPTPEGYTRLAADSGSFADYLRQLTFKKDHPYVYLYDGSLKGYQGAQLKVIDIDVGDKDLQQCADAVMRLKAEHQRQSGQTSNIGFHFLNGDYCSYSKYAEGYRVKVNGYKTSWHKTAKPDYSYKGFMKYMTLVYQFCNTHSMISEMDHVNLKDMKIGDVFIRKSGSIGHAMIVVDLIENKTTGKKMFMLAQSYMPAQEIHVVVNPLENNDSPWYPLDFEGDLHTPEWVFTQGDLYRFKK